MAVYDYYKRDMVALGMSLAGDRSMVEDAAHDVFVTLARKGSTMRIQGRLKPYLTSVLLPWEPLLSWFCS